MLDSISGCSYEKQFSNLGPKMLQATFGANSLAHTYLVFVALGGVLPALDALGPGALALGWAPSSAARWFPISLSTLAQLPCG